MRSYKEIREDTLKLYEDYDDAESSHGEEDDLLWDFISQIAQTEKLSSDAHAALTALLMLDDTGPDSPNHRTRWYA